MEMTGERLIPAPRALVWKALNDPEILKASIPGCSSLVKGSDSDLQAVAAIKVGPITAKFAGKVQLLDLDPPNGYRIVGEGQGGVAGFAKGEASVRLSERDGGTLLQYTAGVQIGGKLAQLGARMIDSTAKQMTGVFFDRFVAAIATPEPVAAAVPEPTVAPPEEPAKDVAPIAAVMIKEAASPAPVAADTWHGGSILLGAAVGAAIALAGVLVGHLL